MSIIDERRHAIQFTKGLKTDVFSYTVALANQLNMKLRERDDMAGLSVGYGVDTSGDKIAGVLSLARGRKTLDFSFRVEQKTTRGVKIHRVDGPTVLLQRDAKEVARYALKWMEQDIAAGQLLAEKPSWYGRQTAFIDGEKEAIRRQADAVLAAAREAGIKGMRASLRCFHANLGTERAAQAVFSLRGRGYLPVILDWRDSPHIEVFLHGVRISGQTRKTVIGIGYRREIPEIVAGFLVNDLAHEMADVTAA